VGDGGATPSAAPGVPRGERERDRKTSGAPLVALMALVVAGVTGMVATARLGEPAAASAWRLRGDAAGDVSPATVAGMHMTRPRAGRSAGAAARRAPVEPGITVLLRDSLHLVRDRRVGLLTNHSALDAAGRRTADLLHGTPGVRLVALFAPEHGLSGTRPGGAAIGAGTDSATGTPIRSLYGRTMVPTAAMLADVDVLLYDVQDVGARPYTFVWSMTLAAESAARRGIPLVVLDRPAPIRGDVLEGGTLRPEFRSLVGRAPVPLRYALTPGEVARWMRATDRLPGDVRVVPLTGWTRTMWYDRTGLPWVRPSPNITTLDAALLFSGFVLFEATNVSEGRGTPKPFHFVGAPWMTDAPAIAAAMNARGLPGLRFAAVEQRIRAGEKHGGRTVPMVEIAITDRDAARPVAAAVWLLREIARRHPTRFRWQAGRGIEELSGSRLLRRAVTTSDEAVDRLLRDWDGEADQFRRAVEAHRLYR